MSVEWEHQFCLACDKQTDGATYCSESCRLADFEKPASTASSGPSSPTFGESAFSWTFAKPTTTTTSKFYLSPAYDFSNPRSYNATSQRASSSLAPSGSTLSPSASHTSLSSIRTNSSTGTTESAYQLSEKATKELRAYARSFESVRLQRRRSY